MPETFDSAAVARRGWRQGTVMGPDVAASARDQAPSNIDVCSTDLLIVTSHDCDVLNPSIAKEPFVEVLCARRIGAVDRMLASGRNPRTLHLSIHDGEDVAPLSCNAHRRWPVSRGLLLHGSPQCALSDRERGLVAEWLAKRYIRAAFPSAFDQRWRKSLRAWQKLLQRWSEWVQGVYLKLSTLTELGDDDSYQCHLVVAVPYGMSSNESWPRQRSVIEDDVGTFWDQFEPGIRCLGVDVLTTDEITLADLEQYQRFDADWISYEDETVSPLMMVDVA